MPGINIIPILATDLNLLIRISRQTYSETFFEVFQDPQAFEVYMKEVFSETQLLTACIPNSIVTDYINCILSTFRIIGIYYQQRFILLALSNAGQSGSLTAQSGLQIRNVPAPGCPVEHPGAHKSTNEATRLFHDLKHKNIKDILILPPKNATHHETLLSK